MTTTCCDLHGRNCEQGDECCADCTEARHGGWASDCGVRRFGHPPGEACSSPVLPVPPFGTCSDCPEPARCEADGCHGMDGVTLTAAELGEIG